MGSCQLKYTRPKGSGLEANEYDELAIQINVM